MTVQREKLRDSQIKLSQKRVMRDYGGVVKYVDVPVKPSLMQLYLVRLSVNVLTNALTN